MQLDGLRSNHRNEIFTVISNVNVILARYPIETFDDYQLIKAQDLRAIIDTFKAFGSIKV